MPIETATYVSDLNTSNPAHSDGLNQADAHARLIKATLKATFAHTGALTNANNQMVLADGTASQPTYTFGSEPTLGFYRSASGILTLTGGKAKGIIPVGSLHVFLVEPAGLGKGGVGNGYDFLELDGSTWNNSDFPDLATHLGQGGTTFTLKNAADTGRFLRSRTSTLIAGTAQSNQNAAHTHGVSATTGTESVGHTHVAAGNTDTEGSSHTHQYSHVTQLIGLSSGLGASTQGVYQIGNSNTSNELSLHTHNFSVTTTDRSAAHTHSFSTTSASSGGNETRPEALVAIFCIKT